MNFVNSILEKQRNDIITGKLFFRETSSQTAKDLDGSDRDLMIVLGSIATPRGLFRGEHLYTIAGANFVSEGGPLILTDLSSQEDISNISIGNSLAGILRGEAGWRI